MSKTVYLLGAGVNRGLANTKGLKPPLDGDFFQLLADQGEALPGEAIPKGPTLPHYRLRHGGAVPPLELASDAGNIYWVYDFIQRFWHRSPEDLAKEPLSLEELLTFLQLKQKDAQKSKNDSEAAKEYLFCELILEHRLLTYLSGFSDIAKANQDMARFGRAIYKERSTVITTNYDTIVETVIEQASNDNPKDGVRAWNARDSYRFRFKEPETRNRALGHVRPLVLKLHGSLNWGTLLIDATTNRPKIEKSLAFYDRPFRNYLDLGLSSSSAGNWLYKPLIVPLILYKDVYYGHPAIKAAWNNAQKELSECERLVVIGYSFPPTDFHIKKLLLDVLFKRDLKELFIVNPDTSVVERIKDITHFQKPVVVCKDIREFLE